MEQKEGVPSTFQPHSQTYTHIALPSNLHCIEKITLFSSSSGSSLSPPWPHFITYSLSLASALLAPSSKTINTLSSLKTKQNKPPPLGLPLFFPLHNHTPSKLFMQLLFSFLHWHIIWFIFCSWHYWSLLWCSLGYCVHPKLCHYFFLSFSSCSFLVSFTIVVPWTTTMLHSLYQY